MAELKTQSTKSWLKIALLSAVLYGIPMGIFSAFQSGRWHTALPAGMIAGLVFGVAFTLVIRAFTLWQTAKFRENPPDFGSESILLEGPSNHFKGVEGVGGYLWLTDGRLHFASHQHNVQNHTWTTPLANIGDVTTVKTLGLIENGLQISTAEETERFVVNNSRAWVEMIRNYINCETEK